MHFNDVVQNQFRRVAASVQRASPRRIIVKLRSRSGPGQVEVWSRLVPAGPAQNMGFQGVSKEWTSRVLQKGV